MRKDQLALYTKDSYKAEREGYMELPTKYDKILKVVNNVTGAGDKSTQILGAGALTRHVVEGQDVNYKAPVQGWEFLVKYWTFSDGISLTKEAVDDTVKLGHLLKDLANTWGISRRVEEESLGARPFNQGGNLLGDWVLNGTHTGQTDSSGDMVYDSEPLFNLTGNTRSTKGGGTYYNSVADLSVEPDDFETVYNLHTAINNRDERDRVISNPADTLLVPPGSMRFAAEKIVDTSRGMPGVNLNDINPFYKIVKTIDWDYLDDYTSGSTEVFYVGKAKSNGIQFHKRQKPEIRFFRDEKNLGYKASINMRMGILVTNFRNWSRGGGTSA